MIPTLSYPRWIGGSGEVIDVLGTPAHILFYVDDVVLVFESHTCL